MGFMPTIATSPPPQITIEAGSHAIEIDVCGCSTVTSKRSEHCATHRMQASRSPGLAIGETRDDGREVLNGKNGFRPETQIESDHS
jgi:hypothetical protein